MIGYVDKPIPGAPEVIYRPAASKDLVLVSISALKRVFFTGIDDFLISAFANKTKAPIVEERLQTLMHILPAT